jgi:elongation factor P
MIPVNQIKSGMVIKLDDKLYTVVSYFHVKPGKGGAFLRTKLRNLKTNNVIEKLLSTNDKVEEVFVEEKKFIYLYRDNSGYHFMDSSTYEDCFFNEDFIQDGKFFLKENMEVTAKMYNGEIVAIEVPTFVELKVIETESISRKDTAKPSTKQAKLETGVLIQVPVFVNTGDIIKVDTRNIQYVERVGK